MGTAELLIRARREARLSQSELAARARTSRPTLSAYEHGRTSPTLRTAARLLAAASGILTAGGAALVAQHLTARPTQDLDFFTHFGGSDVPAARDALETA